MSDCGHKQQGAQRVFIGPWDIKPLVKSSNSRRPASSTTGIPSGSYNLNSELRSDSSVKSLSLGLFNEISPIAQASFTDASFVAKHPDTKIPSWAPGNSGELPGNADDNHKHSPAPRMSLSSFSSLISTGTVRPHTVAPESNQERRPIPTTSLSAPAIPRPQESTRKKLTTRSTSDTQSSMPWNKTSKTFVQHIPAPQRPTTTANFVKRGVLLCMRSVSEHDQKSLPLRYKASREARYGRLTETWRQMEVVLTPTRIATYTSSPSIWPSKSLEYCVYMDRARRPENIQLFMLSSLDRTFCLRYSTKSPKEPFVTLTFHARTLSVCQEWYLYLYQILPPEAKNPCPLQCEVYVPMFDLHVHLPLACDEDAGPRLDITTDDIREAVISVLEKNETVDPSQRDRFGMCWTHRDRVEWEFWQLTTDGESSANLVICPQSIEKTHQLELRLIEHTPNNVVLNNAKLMEPPPVEGFMERMTDFLGKPIKFKSLTPTRFYFASFDQFLFYIPTTKVNSPDPRCYIDSDAQRTFSPIAAPFIATITPYVDDKCIPEEMGRRMSLLSNASGLIDLTEISFVRRTITTTDDLLSINESSHGSAFADSSVPVLGSTHSSNNNNHEREEVVLEMVMDNDIVIKFDVYSRETCDAWVQILSNLVVYWKAHKEAERDAHVQAQFSKTLKSDYLNGSCTPQDLEKTQEQEYNDQLWPTADTRLWSFCVFEQCRDVVKTGVMYFQPRGRGTFSQKTFVLTSNGWLIYFDLFLRSTVTCQPIGSAAHEKKGLLDMADCYVYSGSLAMSNIRHSQQSRYQQLLQQMPVAQQQQAARPPRLYKTGLASDDTDAACVFSLWKPKTRHYFSTKRKQVTAVRSNQKRLNSEGETYTFLAQSRQEKEEWVWAINQVVEHLERDSTQDTTRL